MCKISREYFPLCNPPRVIIIDKKEKREKIALLNYKVHAKKSLIKGEKPFLKKCARRRKTV